MERLRVQDGVVGLIFDCDGTIADTMPAHWAAEHRTFEYFGCRCPHEWLAARSGIPIHLSIASYNAEFGAAIDPALFVAQKAHYLGPALETVLPIAPVTEIIEANRGRLPMAVVSGGYRHHVLQTLQAVKLASDFDVIVTVDDGLPPKPAPDMFLHAARRLGIAPEACQVFEDADSGLEGAVKAGMIATDVRPFTGSIFREAAKASLPARSGL